ncbi:hypothetical protein BH23ACT12_BH23ACT12_18610 [soil metagenome]
MRELEAQLQIPPVSTGIGEARRFTRDQLKAWGVASVADNAILMISELVTNAILHGGEGAVLTLMFNDLKIRAEVRDSNPAVPVVRRYSETATTGRGMVIVDALAATWGTFAVDGGKIVWFELAIEGIEPRTYLEDEQPAGGRAGSDAGSEFIHPAPESINGRSEEIRRPLGRLQLAGAPG